MGTKLLKLLLQRRLGEHVVLGNCIFFFEFFCFRIFNPTVLLFREGLFSKDLFPDASGNTDAGFRHHQTGLPPFVGPDVGKACHLVVSGILGTLILSMGCKGRLASWVSAGHLQDRWGVFIKLPDSGW